MQRKKNMMKSKGYSKGGKMKTKGYAKGGAVNMDSDQVSQHKRMASGFGAMTGVSRNHWQGNVDKNGNPVIHVKGKPRTISKGDPAA